MEASLTVWIVESGNTTHGPGQPANRILVFFPNHLSLAIARTSQLAGIGPNGNQPLILTRVGKASISQRNSITLTTRAAAILNNVFTRTDVHIQIIEVVNGK